MGHPKRDIYQDVTDSIVAAIEKGAGQWSFPWSRQSAMPGNAVTGAAYRGVNVVSLWAASSAHSWAGQWASYKQWQSIGAQVRKGERGSLVVFYKTLERENGEHDDDGNAKVDRIYLARASSIFNADQVDGYEPESVPEIPLFDRLENVERFVGDTGATIRHGGERAFYCPSTDHIQMPPRESFTGTDTSTAQESYYSTTLHELTHWSGHAKRCDRNLSGRFGNEAYAAEELVAELGAAFMCASLGISQTPRPDHAQYVANWLRVLKGDKRAIFTASAKAAQAADFLNGTQTSTAKAA